MGYEISRKALSGVGQAAWLRQKAESHTPARTTQPPVTAVGGGGGGEGERAIENETFSKYEPHQRRSLYISIRVPSDARQLHRDRVRASPSENHNGTLGSAVLFRTHPNVELRPVIL